MILFIVIEVVEVVVVVEIRNPFMERVVNTFKVIMVAIIE